MSEELDRDIRDARLQEFYRDPPHDVDYYRGFMRRGVRVLVEGFGHTEYVARRKCVAYFARRYPESFPIMEPYLQVALLEEEA